MTFLDVLSYYSQYYFQMILLELLKAKMVFHRARIKHVNDVVVNIDTKFLGISIGIIIIDNKLKWTEHIKYIKNKISKYIGIIHKCRYILRNLYNSFVLPYLNYGIAI